MTDINIAPSDIERIANRTINAIMEQRLSPGSKLSEVRMAEAFKVSRTKIRQVLSVLSRTGLVRIYPNRGAYIVSPGVAEAKEILAARRLIEPELLRGVINRQCAQTIASLRQHVINEKDARATKNRREIIRLSGDFHMLLAESSGNRYLTKAMGELCPLTCLVIALHDVPQAPACPENDHEYIVDAIEAGLLDEAIKLMGAHLHHIESALRLDSATDNDVIWERLLG